METVWRERKLVKQPERKRLCSANTAVGYKLSGCDNRSECAFECLCALMLVPVDLCGEKGASACVCARLCVRWWKEASTASAACAAGCFSPPPPAFFLFFVSRLVTMSGGERPAVPVQHHSSHMSNSYTSCVGQAAKISISSLSLSLSSVCQAVSLFIPIVAPNVINDFRGYIIFQLFEWKHGVIDQHFHILSLFYKTDYPCIVLLIRVLLRCGSEDW